MNFPRPVRFLLLFLLVFVGGMLYLRFGRDESWGGSLLIALISAPFVLGWWKFRDWYMGRARAAGRNWRESRE
ncbi:MULTISPECIES: hypothetical protein [unclassified Streptomyces]|uniref:hypothetical protein n=2 Tax=Streptomyces TaxID=1883 RepID=UPI00344B651D